VKLPTPKQHELPHDTETKAESKARRAREILKLMMREPVVTYAHAARMLGVTRTRARQLAIEGDLRTTTQDGRTYVTKASVDQLLAKRSRN
jgi:hypothetical protein